MSALSRALDSALAMHAVDATEDNIADFLAHPVRAVDSMEWHLAHGEKLSAELIRACTVGSPVRGMLNGNGRCICLWGAVPDGVTADIGLVWLIASRDAESNATAIHRFWRLELALMHHRFARLVALSHVDNALHHRWLGEIGFVHATTMQAGPLNAPFAAFVRVREEADDVRN